MDDTIYRQDAIDAVKKNTFRLTFAEEQNCEGHVAWSANAVYSDVIEGALLELPSAQPNLDECCLDCKEYDQERHSCPRWNRVIRQTVEDLKTEQPERTGWIPCSERLPENNNDVLVTDGTDCAVAYWRTDAQAWDDSMHGWCDLYGLEVIAWMPLPKPYKEGDGNETN